MYPINDKIIKEVDRIETLLSLYNLPVDIPDNMTSAEFLFHMRKDKKNKQGRIRFIVPTKLGNCALVDDVSDDAVSTLIGR